MFDHFTPVYAGMAGGSFSKLPSTAGNRCPVCIIFMRDSDILEVSLRLVEVDGLDVTPTAIGMLRRHDFDFVITRGASFSGFNVIDIRAVSREFNKPVIVYMTRMPNLDSILHALMKHFPDWRQRWALFQGLAPVHSTFLNNHGKMVYFEVVGASSETAELILRDTTRLSPIPEAVRISRLVARGVSLREP